MEGLLPWQDLIYDEIQIILNMTELNIEFERNASGQWTWQLIP